MWFRNCFNDIYDADGYRVLENKEELKNSNLKEWANFISAIEEKILNNEFRLTLQFLED